jgi:hypothetical protein
MWLDYSNTVSATSSIEIQYTVYDNDYKSDTGRILAKGRDKVVWIVTGKSRFVWNTTDGIWIDDTYELYLYFKSKSEFFSCCPVEVPGIIQGPAIFVNDVKLSRATEGQRSFDVLSFGDQGIDTMDRFWYYFDVGSHLPARIERKWGGLWSRGNGTKRYEISSYRLNSQIDEDEFELSPPPGYRPLR